MDYNIILFHILAITFIIFKSNLYFLLGLFFINLMAVDRFSNQRVSLHVFLIKYHDLP